MLTILPLDFNHDYRDKAERFQALVASLEKTDCFNSPPKIEDTPVFSYCRTGRALLDSLFARLGDGDAIIFLSDICSYSYALVQSAKEVHHVSSVMRYKTTPSFLETSTIRGNCVSDKISLQIDAASATFVGMMPSPYSSDLVDLETDNPNPDIVDVIFESPGDGGSVFVYRLRDASRYLNCIVRSEWVTYVVPGAIDAELAVSHYRRESLTDHLFASGREFGTFNDNHQDDCYAVSYFATIWDLPDETLAFVA